MLQVEGFDGSLGGVKYGAPYGGKKNTLLFADFHGGCGVWVGCACSFLDKLVVVSNRELENVTSSPSGTTCFQKMVS